MVDGAERSFSEEFLDALLPEELDWQRLATSYPLTAILVAAGCGYWLGRKSGALIVAAISETATERVTGLVDQVIGGDEV